MTAKRASRATAKGAAEPTLHARIRAAIEDKIVSGAWPPGHRIPFEHELTARYGCSRMTVSKALTQLAEAGLIARRRRAGSFVARPRARAAVLDIHDIESEVAALGLPYGFTLTHRRRRKAGADDRAKLGLSGPAAVLDLRCLHFAGERPFCLERRLINLAAVPEAEAHDFAGAAPGAWLLARVPWVAAEHRIRAMAAGRLEAAALRAPVGSACLVIQRRTWSAEHIVTHVTLTYPGADHELVARFLPSSNQALWRSGGSGGQAQT